MSKIVLEIKDASFIGGGMTYHAEYEIAVQYDNQNWSVFRRFSHFEELYKHLERRVGGESAIFTKGIRFPEKSYWGSYLSADKSTTDHRKKALQKFLSEAFATNEFDEDGEVLRFIDEEHKGVSGLQRDLGAQRIVKETFCKVLISKQIPGFIWSRCYVALTIDGYIYITPSIYDDSSNCIAVWCLTTAGVSVKAKGPAIQLSASSHPLKLKLAFSSGPEMTFWIRTMTNFTMPAPSTTPSEKTS